jgi:hypothetical protein
VISFTSFWICAPWILATIGVGIESSPAESSETGSEEEKEAFFAYCRSASFRGFAIQSGSSLGLGLSPNFGREILGEIRAFASFLLGPSERLDRSIDFLEAIGRRSRKHRDTVQSTCDSPEETISIHLTSKSAI